MSLTRELAAFCATVRCDDLPRAALVFIRTGFTDCVATLVAGRYSDEARILREVLRPPAGESDLLFGLATARAHEAALDQRHRRARARLRRCRAARPPQRRAGARDPCRSRGDRRLGRRDGAGLCRRLRDLGRAGAARARPASQQGLASDRHIRRHRRRGRLRLAARSRRGAGRARARARRFAKRRPDVQLRHHDEAVPRGARRACRRGGGASRPAGIHRIHSTRSSTRKASSRGVAGGPGRPSSRRSEAGRVWKLARRRPERQEVSGVLCTPPCARRHARPAGAASGRRRRRCAASWSRPAGATSPYCATSAADRRSQAKFSMEFAMASALIGGRAGLPELHRRIRAPARRAGADAARRGAAGRARRPAARRRCAVYDEVTLETDGRPAPAQHRGRRTCAAVRSCRSRREELWAKFEGCVAGGRRCGPGAAAVRRADVARAPAARRRSLPGSAA